MAHIVSGELRKDTFTKQTSNGMMYSIELSEHQKDKEGNSVYTNYRAAFFPKSQGMTDLLNKALVKGNFVVISCDKLKIDVSDCGQYTKLDMNFAKLDNFIECGNSQGQAPQQSYQQPVAQQAPQQNYQQPAQPPQQQYNQAPPQNVPAQQYNQPQQVPHNPNDPNNKIPF
jgi:hypothetical protein